MTDRQGLRIDDFLSGRCGVSHVVGISLEIYASSGMLYGIGRGIPLTV